MPAAEVAYSGVVELATGAAREAAWDNVLARHKAALPATTWTTRRQRLGAHTLIHPRFASDDQWRSAVPFLLSPLLQCLSLLNSTLHQVCTSVELSGCGNFAILGYSSGHVDMWNIQSGIHRGSFKVGVLKTLCS